MSSIPGMLVLSKPDALSQVWTNLIANALQAMGYRGTLTITLRAEDPWIVADVQDDGPGIPPEIQDRIFTPFFTTKGPGEGTGLGLDICRQIVESQGGRIQFQSRPGLTVFSVYLRKAP